MLEPAPVFGGGGARARGRGRDRVGVAGAQFTGASGQCHTPSLTGIVMQCQWHKASSEAHPLIPFWALRGDVALRGRRAVVQYYIIITDALQYHNAPPRHCCLRAVLLHVRQWQWRPRGGAGRTSPPQERHTIGAKYLFGIRAEPRGLFNPR